MTRTLARRSAVRSNVRIVRENFSGTAVASLRTFGRAAGIAQESVAGTFTDIARREFQWKEAILQAWRLVTVTAIPAILMANPFGVIVSVQVGNLLHTLGADSLLGATGGLGVIKQGAPLATGFLLGGAGAAALAADLGARTIREEIDAMKVMGVDPMRRLVAPRLGAAMLVSVLLCGFVVFVGFLTGYVFNIFAQGGTPGSYVGTFASFAITTDLFVALLKSLIFGVLAAIIACDAGLNTRGGPGGVANSVNTAVVMSAVMLFGVNLILTQVYNSLFPPQMV